MHSVIFNEVIKSICTCIWISRLLIGRIRYFFYPVWHPAGGSTGVYKIPRGVIHMETSVGKEQQHIGLGWVVVTLAGWLWPWLGGCGLGWVGVALARWVWLWLSVCGFGSVCVTLARCVWPLVRCVWPWLGVCGLWFGVRGLGSVGVALDLSKSMFTLEVKRYTLRSSEMTHFYKNSLVSWLIELCVENPLEKTPFAVKSNKTKLSAVTLLWICVRYTWRTTTDVTRDLGFGASFWRLLPTQSGIGIGSVTPGEKTIHKSSKVNYTVIILARDFND